MTVEQRICTQCAGRGNYTLGPYPATKCNNCGGKGWVVVDSRNRRKSITINDSAACAPCGDVRCNQNREQKMVVVQRDVKGQPTVWCDPCLVDLIAALNAAGIVTIASCCGHGRLAGHIALADGRELTVTTPLASSIEATTSDAHGNQGEQV